MKGLVRRIGPTVRDAVRLRYEVGSAEEHLAATMDWLVRAQDATPDGGVSRSYTLRWMRSHKRIGWLASYPETTGYIIPTFLKYGKFAGDPRFEDRALKMADWESDVQMVNGAVQGGVIDFKPTPAIFNTGQVLFGWAAAYSVSKNERYLESATRAGDFLVKAQDPDGAWRTHGSQYARRGLNLYDARTAWGLLEGSFVTGDERHRLGAIKNLEFVLTKQRPNGWFEECCLDDNDRPLLHTIAYTMEGLLEAGIALDNEAFREAAKKAADRLIQLQRPNGSLAGRFDENWNGAANWSCLTGDAQTAIVWFRLYQVTGEQRYRDAACRMNRYLSATQDRSASNDGIRGGIKGSEPIWGDYGTYEYLNWAAKFFADALMLEIDTRS